MPGWQTQSRCPFTATYSLKHFWLRALPFAFVLLFVSKHYLQVAVLRVFSFGADSMSLHANTFYCCDKKISLKFPRGNFWIMHKSTPLYSTLWPVSLASLLHTTALIARKTSFGEKYNRQLSMNAPGNFIRLLPPQDPIYLMEHYILCYKQMDKFQNAALQSPQGDNACSDGCWHTGVQLNDSPRSYGTP